MIRIWIIRAILGLIAIVSVGGLSTERHNETMINMSELVVEPTPIYIEETHPEVEDVQEEVQEEPLSRLEIVTLNMQAEMEKLESITDKKEWFQEYKNIIFRYIKWFDAPETVFDVYTPEEVELICRVVETECYQQPFEAKVNVASVVFNRIEDGRFGESVEEVVTSPKQFVYGRKNLTEDTILAVQYAYEIEDTTDGALYFHSHKNRKDTFYGAKYIFSDQAGHHFYK